MLTTTWRKSVPTNRAAAANTHQTPQLAVYSYHICHHAAHAKLGNYLE